jgi:hypothetical protein
MKWPAFVILGFLLLAPRAADADCASPAKAAGEIIYNTDHNILQYCDGTDWIAMGKPVQASCATTWTDRATEMNNWYSVAYGAGVFATVGVLQSGTHNVITSPDGVTWTARSVPEANSWYAVTYGGGQFVAVAGTGTNRVMTSPDGMTWTARAAAQANTWYGVAYGNGVYVAVARDGTNRVMTSPDGITWTARTAAEANTWVGVAYGGGVFVAVSQDGTHRVMTSPDGLTWTARPAAEANSWNAITYGNGQFVAVASTGTNKVMTSPDGVTWTAHAAAGTNAWWAVAYGNGMYAAVSQAGSNPLMTSPDGINWTSRAVTPITKWDGVTYGNGKFVAVAFAGSNRAMDSSCPAGCSAPDNNAGTIIYNADHHVMQYCNGADWVGMGRPTIDPCNPANSPSPGQLCIDGSVYAGISPDGSVPMYTTPSDAPGTYTWNNGSITDFYDTMTHCQNPPGTGGNPATCWQGASNTAAVSALSDSSSPYAAVTYCAGLSAHGEADWYLPSQDELNVVYSNRAAIGNFNLTGSFPSGYYWSSSENWTDSVKNQKFSDGTFSNRIKYGAISIRCVRKGYSGGSGAGTCANPARAEGTMIYNADCKVMEYCNGVDWRPVGKQVSSAPGAFSFTDQTNVGLSTLVTSDVVTIIGLGCAASVSVMGQGNPQIRVNGGSWTNGPTTISNGQTLEARLTSNAALGVTNTATVTVGSAADDWNVTTYACTKTVTSSDSSIVPANAQTISYSLTGGGGGGGSGNGTAGGTVSGSVSVAAGDTLAVYVGGGGGAADGQGSGNGGAGGGSGWYGGGGGGDGSGGQGGAGGGGSTVLLRNGSPVNYASGGKGANGTNGGGGNGGTNAGGAGGSAGSFGDPGGAGAVNAGGNGAGNTNRGSGGTGGTATSYAGGGGGYGGGGGAGKIIGENQGNGGSNGANGGGTNGGIGGSNGAGGASSGRHGGNGGNAVLYYTEAGCPW